MYSNLHILHPLIYMYFICFLIPMNIYLLTCIPIKARTSWVFRINSASFKITIIILHLRINHTCSDLWFIKTMLWLKQTQSTSCYANAIKEYKSINLLECCEGFKFI